MCAVKVRNAKLRNYLIIPIIVTGFCQPQLSFEKVRNLFDLFAIDQSMQRHSVKIVNVAQ
jgi:hypothetical protein